MTVEMAGYEQADLVACDPLVEGDQLGRDRPVLGGHGLRGRRPRDAVADLDTADASGLDKSYPHRLILPITKPAQPYTSTDIRTTPASRAAIPTTRRGESSICSRPRTPKWSSRAATTSWAAISSAIVRPAPR